MDLRGFTKLALANPPSTTATVLQAVALAANEHFRGFGAYVLDYTDGAMAVFETPTPAAAAWAALDAVSFILTDIRTVVNEELELAEDLTVRAAAGLEWGDVVWTRLGDSFSSQVKPVSGVAFLAGKNSASPHTGAWQALMGQRLSALVPDDLKKQGPNYDFQLNGKKFHEPRWFFEWEAFLQARVRDEHEARRRFARLATTGAAEVISPSPAGGVRRPLRDAPYAS